MYLELVSIIIPVYNAEKYIDLCLESVCNQSYKNIEILLMVGMCNDNSLLKCIEWQKRDNRIVIVSRKDTSLGDARNYALNLAKGKYLAYVDADDYIDKYFVEELVTPLEKDETITLTCCGLDKFDECGFYDGWIPKCQYLKNTNLKEYLENICFGTVWLKMYRKEWIISNEIIMFDGCHEDDAMHISVASIVDNVYCIQKALYHYNIGNNTSLMHGKKQIAEYVKALKFTVEYLKKYSLFEKNKIVLQNRVTRSLDEHMRMFHYEPQSILEVDDFLKAIFPDVYEEKKLSINYEKSIEDVIVLFGAGADVKRAIELVGQNNIYYIVDNNQKYHGTYINNILVVSYETLLHDKRPKIVLISSSAYYYEIAKQLRQDRIYNYMSVRDYPVFKLFYDAEKRKRVILFNTPEHTNIGDHAIAECEKAFLRKYFSNYNIIEITEYMYSNYKNIITKYIGKEDLIIITGGGFLGSLWLERGENIVREIISDYFDNRIVVFPQTLWFEDGVEGKKQKQLTKSIYERANHLILMLREPKSYIRAKNLFSEKICCVEIPDIVLSVKGYDCIENRENIGALCLKNDCESILTIKQKEYIEDILSYYFMDIRKISMHYDCPIKIENRKKVIEEKLNEIKKYRIVVTDALHCMIFCAVTGTPCIALNNITGKLKGVYEWIKELPYILYVDKECQLNEKIDKLLLLQNNEYTFSYNEYEEIIFSLIKNEV